MQRRRYATLVELVGLLAERDIDPAEAERVLDALAALGVPVDQLVKIVADEPMPEVPGADPHRR